MLRPDAPAPQAVEAPDPRRWYTLAIVLIGFLMILIDTTVVNVSIPAVVKDLGATLTDIEWVISGYALTFAALLITFGRLGDLFGRKLFFLTGLVLFGLASIACGEAATPNQLIGFRLLQGLGGAMISPSVLSIITSSFRGKERAIAFGSFGAVSGIAVALGPVLGGYFTTYYSWRWIFRINIPVAIVGIVLGALYIKESRDLRTHKVDLIGMLLSALASFFLIFALIEGETYGWISQSKQFVLGSFSWPSGLAFSVIPVAFILGLATLAAFIAVQGVKTRRKTDPAVDLTLFASPAFRYGLIAIAIIALGEFSSLFTLPIFLQNVRGYTPLQTGYATLPLALAAFICAPLSAKIVNRIGSKRVITVGIFIEFLGLLLFSFVKADSSYLSLVPAYVILGAGIGLAVAQNTQVTLSQIDPRESGAASGILNTVRQLGTSFGIAIIGAVVASQFTSLLPTKLSEVPGLPEQAKASIIRVGKDAGVTATANALKNIPSPSEADRAARDRAVAEATTEAIRTSIRVGAAFVFLGALLSLRIPDIKQEYGEDAPPAAAH